MRSDGWVSVVLLAAGAVAVAVAVGGCAGEGSPGGGVAADDGGAHVHAGVCCPLTITDEPELALDAAALAELESAIAAVALAATVTGEGDRS